jgi:hypothetical protein
MRVHFLLYALVALCNYAYCQDKTNYNYYVGKKININPLDNTKRYVGYENFVLSIENPDDKKNIAFASARSLNSAYDSLVNKAFDCIDGGELPHYVNRQYLKLKSADNKIIYYIYYKREEPLAISRIDDKQLGKVKIKKNQEVTYRTGSYLNKTYWLKDNVLYTFDEPSNKYDIYKSNSLKFQSVTVTAVLPSPSSVNPYRLIIKTSTGKIGYVDFDDSETANYDDMSLTPINTKKNL